MTVALTHEHHQQLVENTEIVDLIIGWYNDYLRTKEYGYPLHIRDIYSPMDYLDKRKNMLTMFNYCPYSGKKINWNKIKQELKDKIK